MPDPRNYSDENVLSLSNAVFCLDCEAIGNTRRDECPSCRGRSLVNLGRMLGGTLLAHRGEESRRSGMFDITITVELQGMYGKDLSTTVERLTSVIGPKLARDRATLRVSVKPTVDPLYFQESLQFPELDAA